MKKETTQEAAPMDINVQLKVKTIQIPIVGIAPLIMNRFDDKSKREMEDSAPKKLKQGKKNIETPEEQFRSSINFFADGKTYGMPAVSFKSAMVRAAQVCYNMQMIKTRTLYHVVADDPETGLVKINGECKMREDMVRVGGITKVASPRYRACFPNWNATVTIRFLEDAISEEQLVGILNAAGFTCGIGEWRPEKSNSGSFGLFQVANRG